MVRKSLRYGPSIAYKITPAGSLSSSQPDGPPCRTSALAFGLNDPDLVHKFGPYTQWPIYCTTYMHHAEDCTVRILQCVAKHWAKTGGATRQKEEIPCWEQLIFFKRFTESDFLKLFRSAGIDSKESIPPAWRAGTTTLLLLVPSPHKLF